MTDSILAPYRQLHIAMRTHLPHSAVFPLGAGLLLGACSADSAPPGPSPEKLEAARTQAAAVADELGQQLVAALGEAIQRSGPVGAIEVCQLRAPQIAAELGQQRKIEVGRTALRLRNPANAPDAFERGVLEQFERELAGGAQASSLHASRSVPDENGWRYEWLRPIALQPMCVVCHGDQLAPELRDELARRYPADQATGFKPGELRGAFTVSLRIPRE
jgi:hypothetical protein